MFDAALNYALMYGTILPALVAAVVVWRVGLGRALP